MSDVTDYLLGELDPERVPEFEARLRTDAALRAEVDSLRPVVSRLSALPPEVWDPVAPPPLRLPETERAPAPAPVKRRRRLVLRPALAMACAVVLLAAGVGLGVLIDRDPAPAAQLALRPLEGVDRSANAQVGVSGDRVTLRVTGLPPTNGDEFYELWLLGAEQQLVGLGSFRVDAKGEADLRLPLPVDPASFEYFDISLEPGDGNPGHSGDSVLRGPAT